MEVSKAVEIDELIAKFLSTPIPHCELTSGNFFALHKIAMLPHYKKCLKTGPSYRRLISLFPV